MMVPDYTRSLKLREAEELFDLWFYRPIAYALVRLVYTLPITPNQVTMLSLLCGILAGVSFSFGTAALAVVGSSAYLIANILDCADGQLARMQDSGTLLGRVLDGAADYLSSLVIFLGIGVGLQSAGLHLWWLVIGAALSTALHAMFFDHYQGEFISTVKGEQDFLEREDGKFRSLVSALSISPGNFFKGGIVRLYLWYLNLQRISTRKRPGRDFAPTDYQVANHLMIRLWSFLGPTTNRSVLIIAAMFDRIDIFLLVVVTLGNAWLLVCWLVQWSIQRTLIRMKSYQSISIQRDGQTGV